MNQLKLITILLLLEILFSCNKYDLKRTNPFDPHAKNYNPDLPELTTATFTNINSTAVTAGGNITDEGGSDVIKRGVCWSTLTNPTIANNKTSDGTGPGSFNSYIRGLTENTTYFVRSYATNIAGTGYGNERSFTTNILGNSITDIDGNDYHIVNIGTQIWTGENLKVTRFNDASDIPEVKGGPEWSNLTTPGICFYYNDRSVFMDIYGALYNWYAINTGKLCPIGWHVSSDNDWHILISYLDNDIIHSDQLSFTESFTAGAKLKESGTKHWQNSSSEVTNETNFGALPGGFRFSPDTGEQFYYNGTWGVWWSPLDESRTMSRGIALDNSISRINYPKEIGMSVRCVKN